MVCLHSITLDDVRIDGSLGKELDSVKFSRLLLEHPDELCSDDLPLRLRICDACKLVKEAVNGINIDKVGVHLVAEDLYDLLRLTLSQKPVIDMHACELLADGLDQKCRHDRGVNASGECQKDLLVADLGPELLDLLFDECIRKFRCRDALHAFRSDVGCHVIPLVFV